MIEKLKFDGFQSTVEEIEFLQDKVNEILNNIKRALGTQQITETLVPTNFSSIQMWKDKLGNSGASRIFTFLAEKAPMKFSRSQIGLAVGLSSSSGSFATYMATLKRNRLILEEGGFSKLNPDL